MSYLTGTPEATSSAVREDTLDESVSQTTVVHAGAGNATVHVGTDRANIDEVCVSISHAFIFSIFSPQNGEDEL